MKISRRKLMGWMGLSGGTALGTQLLGTGDPLAELLDVGSANTSTDQTSPTRWDRKAEHNRELTKDVTWLTHEPLIYVLRQNEASDDEPGRYRRMVDPDNLKRMADAGVIFGRIFFYKGFGLEYEKPHIEQAKRATAIMHRLGMKVSLYVAGTMFIEALYREIPAAENWEARDCSDHWIPYGDIQTYRHFACLNNPAYKDYLKRVIKIGIQDVGADELAFDQITLQSEPRSCRCPWCIDAFRAFLRRRYPTRETVMRRFGLPDVDWIRVTQWVSNTQQVNLANLNDPVLQEWTRFRCEYLAKYASDLYSYAKDLNSNVAVSFNMKGVFSDNHYWTNAVYHPLFVGHVDRISFDTGGYDAQVDPVTGALISQIRSYKVARQLGACSEDADSLDDEVRAAVHMAFSYRKPVCTAAPFGPGAFNVFTPIIEFFREYNDRYYTETDSVTDVAVIRNWPSMAYSISATYIPVTLMEQVLIQYKVPFDLLFEEQFNRIDRYAAVILVGQECVSDAEVALLKKYVRSGGTVIVSGKAGQFNEWREERTVSPLPPPGREGKGRFVYIPEIVRGDMLRHELSTGDLNPEPGLNAKRGMHIIPTQWVLPKNHEAIYKSIVDATPGGFSITTEAPLTTVMELLNRPKTRETIAHFINFDRENRTAPFAVILRKQYSESIKSITCITPDLDSPINLSFKESGGSVKFIVPAVRVYAMIVVAH